MNDSIKDFIVEHSNNLGQGIFLTVSFGLFLFVVWHAMKIKGKPADEISQTVLEDDA